MNDNYYATIGYTKHGMFTADVREDVFGDKSYMVPVCGCQDFSCTFIHQYLHQHGVPYENVTVEI